MAYIIWIILDYIFYSNIVKYCKIFIMLSRENKLLSSQDNELFNQPGRNALTPLGFRIWD